MKPDLQQLANLVQICAAFGVRVLKAPGVSIEFHDSPGQERPRSASAARVSENSPIPEPPAEPVVTKPEALHPEASQTDYSEVELQEDRIAEMRLSDPYEYEQAIARGDFEDSK